MRNNSDAYATLSVTMRLPRFLLSIFLTTRERIITDAPRSSLRFAAPSRRIGPRHRSVLTAAARH